MLRYLGFLFAMVLSPSAALAQAFDNNSVVSLHQAGLGETTIVTKINSLPCGYDVSTDGLISLKKSGLSDSVIAAMVSRCVSSSRAQGADNGSADPLVKHTPGIYLAQEWLSPPKLLLIRPATGSGNRTTGNGSIVFPLKSLLVIPQGESQNRSAVSRPIFYFYFNTADRNVSDFGTDGASAAQSPSEFSLIKFKLKNNSREVEIGRLSAYFSINMRKGVNVKDTNAFSATEIGDGIFKVSAASDLAPGEYAFIYSSDNGRSRVYDFSIPPGPAVEPKK